MEILRLIATCRACRAENTLPLMAGEKILAHCSKCGVTLLDGFVAAGHIYVLSNPKMHGLLKIGFSVRPVEERVEELSSATGVPAPFEIEATFLSVDPKSDESAIHAQLAAHRVTGREFFAVTLAEALAAIREVCKRDPIYLKGQRTQPNEQSAKDARDAQPPVPVGQYQGRIARYEISIAEQKARFRAWQKRAYDG